MADVREGDPSKFKQRCGHFRKVFSLLDNPSKQKLLLALLQHVPERHELAGHVALLQSALTKDFVYASSKHTPSLDTDSNVESAGTRAPPTPLQEQTLTSVLSWLSGTDRMTRWRLACGVLSACDVHLLCSVYPGARNLLTNWKQTGGTPAELIGGNILRTVRLAEGVGSSNLEDVSLEADQSKLVPTFQSDVGFVSTTLTEGSPQTMTPSNSDAANEAALTSVSATSKISSASWSFLEDTAGTDILRRLPVHLSKRILGLLDSVSLGNAVSVSAGWRELAVQVQRENRVRQLRWEDAMLMQGSMTGGVNPRYAKFVEVPVPVNNIPCPNSTEIISEIKPFAFKSSAVKPLNIRPSVESRDINSVRSSGVGLSSQKEFSKSHVAISSKAATMEERNIYCETPTMEERNIYCGAYNVMVVSDTRDTRRVMHMDGSDLIAVGSGKKSLRLLNTSTGQEAGPIISGHSGSITCCYLLNSWGLVLTGSYDTSVRCWSTQTGRCVRILRGHQDTVNCVAVLHARVATGSRDNSCRVWDLRTGKCQQTFKHHSSVLTVALGPDLCVTGCQTGKVKVWGLASGDLIKVLNGHQAAVTAVKCDEWHIVTGGLDGYVFVWSAVGGHSQCVTSLRHPKEVLCLEFTYLRVVSGSADGRIRVWNMLTGQCCRVMRGNSGSDPVISLTAVDNRIAVNTHNSLLVLHFEKVDWDYTLESDQIATSPQTRSRSAVPARCLSHSYVRAQRLSKLGMNCIKTLGRHSSFIRSKSACDRPYTSRGSTSFCDGPFRLSRLTSSFYKPHMPRQSKSECNNSTTFINQSEGANSKPSDSPGVKSISEKQSSSPALKSIYEKPSSSPGLKNIYDKPSSSLVPQSFCDEPSSSLGPKSISDRPINSLESNIYDKPTSYPRLLGLCDKPCNSSCNSPCNSPYQQCTNICNHNTRNLLTASIKSIPSAFTATGYSSNGQMHTTAPRPAANPSTTNQLESQLSTRHFQTAAHSETSSKMNDNVSQPLSDKSPPVRKISLNTETTAERCHLLGEVSQVQGRDSLLVELPSMKVHMRPKHLSCSHFNNVPKFGHHISNRHGISHILRPHSSPNKFKTVHNIHANF